MDKFNLNIELDNHLSYYKSISEEWNKIGELSEKFTLGIIEKQEKTGEITPNDFIDLELASLRSNIIQTDMVKVIARIRLLYQIMFGSEVEISLSEDKKNILDAIISDEDPDFIFYQDKGNLVFKNQEMEEGIKQICIKRASIGDIKEKYESLKSSYESFLKNTNRHVGKEA